MIRNSNFYDEIFLDFINSRFAQMAPLSINADPEIHITVDEIIDHYKYKIISLTPDINEIHAIAQRCAKASLNYLFRFHMGPGCIGNRQLVSMDIRLNPTRKSHEYYNYNLISANKPKLDIKEVKFNPPATIIFWKDGTKTVVKCQENEEYDPEKGLAMAIVKKQLGNNGHYYTMLRKWLPDEYKKEK